MWKSCTQRRDGAVCYEPERDHQSQPFSRLNYNAWIRYQLAMQKAMVATRNNLELLGAIVEGIKYAKRLVRQLGGHGKEGKGRTQRHVG